MLLACDYDIEILDIAIFSLLSHVRYFEPVSHWARPNCVCWQWICTILSCVFQAHYVNRLNLMFICTRGASIIQNKYFNSRDPPTNLIEAELLVVVTHQSLNVLLSITDVVTWNRSLTLRVICTPRLNRVSTLCCSVFGFSLKHRVQHAVVWISGLECQQKIPKCSLFVLWLRTLCLSLVYSLL